MTSNERILQPFTLPNGTELKNRLLMAPMTTCTGYFDGTVTSELVEYYRARAGSIGTIIVECCFIDDYGLAFPGAIGIDNDEKIAGLAKIAEAIKAEGSKAILQIYHGGRMVDPQLIGGRQPVAPSAIAAPREGAAMPRALSGEEVEGMIAKFGDGVRRAILAGFDGVEIHGANTYLIQQFYSPNSNQRDDEWGGSRDNRARFPLAVLDITHKMARQYADDAFIIGYRFSPEEMEVPGIRFDDTMYLLEKLAARGVDYLHFSVGATLRPSIVDTSDPTPLIKNVQSGEAQTIDAKYVFIGAGGGALKLLQKTGIPEADNYAGFPVGGSFLMTEIPAVTAQHLEKVYGQASVGAPPMSVPHLDARYLDGKRVVLFGPFATFSTKFLKNGSFFDLLSTTTTNNVLPMTHVGLDNFDLVKYLVSQVMLSDDDRFAALKEYYPDARKEDWKLIQAGQRVQIIKKDAEKGGVLKLGTEVVVDQQKTISALLGASPGASTAAPITLNVLKQMFPQQFNSPEWQSRIHAIVPSYGQKLNGNVALTQQVWDDTAATLQLTKPPVIQMPAAAPTATAKPAETPREASPQHDMAL